MIPALFPASSLTFLTKNKLSFRASCPANINFSYTQDEIGWFNFMEGKITNEIRSFQHKYLISISSSISIHTWISKLISHLLHIIHSQWLYRNEVVHRKTQDGLKRSEGAAIRIAIRVQLRLGRHDLDAEDHFLLHHTYNEISTWSGEEKKLWLHAIKSARQAAVLNTATASIPQST